VPKIIHRLDGKVIKEYPTNLARKLSVGRKAENDICLDDSTVSGKHAVFDITPSPYVHKHSNDVFIEDVGSTNGTLLDGKKINKEQLKHGDTVKIGPHEFLYVDEEQLRMDQTVVINPEDGKK